MHSKPINLLPSVAGRSLARAGYGCVTRLKIKMSKWVILGQLFLLVAYIVLYQLYFYAGFTGDETIITEDFVYFVWWPLVVLNLAVTFLEYKDMKPREIKNKPAWVVYMLISAGIGTAHYFFKYYKKSDNAS